MYGGFTSLTTVLRSISDWERQGITYGGAPSAPELMMEVTKKTKAFPMNG